MARRFRLSDGTVGMLEDDGTFVPETAEVPAPVPPQSKQVHGGIAGPGSTDAEPSGPMTARPVGLLEQAVHGSPGGRGYATPEEDAARRERARREDPVANDPLAQAVIAAPLAAGVGALAGPALGAALPNAPRAVQALTGASEGATAAGVTGSNPVLGAALGAIPGATAAIGEGALARSAARGANPVREAAREAARKALEHVRSGKGMPEVAAHYLGHAVGAPEIATAIPAALHVGIPAARVGAIAADEALAGIARPFFTRAGVPTRTVASEVPSAVSTVGSHQLPHPVPREATRTQVEPPRREPEPVSNTPRIRPPAEHIKIPNTYEESMAQMGTPVPAARLPVAPPAPEPTEVTARHVTPPRGEVIPLRPPSEPPKWQPSKYDDKYARKVHKTPAEYHAMMNERLARAHATMSDPNASLRARAEAAWTLRGTTNAPNPGESEALEAEAQ